MTAAPQAMRTSDRDIDGVLPIDKPAGPTSHDMVAAARRALRTRRIGHTGTLDPFASGLLLLCVGPSTRIAEYLSGLDKTYRARVRLGQTTDTDDATGEVQAERAAAGVSRAGVEVVLTTMRGDVLQRPPAYSAKKRGGERAYAAARAGRPLELEPVAVHIDDISITAFDPPLIDLEITCGSGTYIRAIARDLGEALGTGAHLTELRRTRIGTIGVETALPLDALGDEAAVMAALLPPLRALAHLPRVEIDGTELEHVRHGRALRGRETVTADAGVVLLADADRLVAVAECRDGVLHPRKVLL
jgi:tRNA pseudouridine55 synthase